MSIKPVDMQILMKNLETVSKVQDNAITRVESTNEQIANNNINEYKISSNQVMSGDKTEKNGVNEDSKGNSAYNNKKKRNRKKSTANDEDVVDDGHFDIKI